MWGMEMQKSGFCERSTGCGVVVWLGSLMLFRQPFNPNITPKAMPSSISVWKLYVEVTKKGMG